MRTITVMNQKGGVGKTTTSVNLAAGLANLGKRVCVVDLDPQGHASLHLGVEAFENCPTVYDIFAGDKTFAEVRKMVNSHLWVVPSNIDLAAAEMELADVPNRELLLRNAFDNQAISELFDYIIMDCPPSLGVLTVNSLTASSEVFIPLQPHFFALQGMSKLFETCALVRQRLNPKLRVTGIVMCLYESGTRLASDVTDDLNTFLENSGPDAPWAGAKMFRNKIRRNIKLAEAPSFGQSIFDYAPSCPGSQDYSGLAEEVLEMEDAAVRNEPLRKAA